MIKEIKILEDFIPRNQQDRMTLANLEMLSEINENIKSLIELLRPTKQEEIVEPIIEVKKKRTKKTE